VLAILNQIIIYLIPSLSVSNNLTTALALGIPSITLLIAMSILNVILIWLMYIAIIKIVTYKRANQEVSVGKIIEDAKTYLGSYSGLSMLMGLALFGLFILLIIPGVIFAVFWTFAPYILILENKGISESMSESKKLVTGRWWKVFGYNFLFFLIMFGIGIGMGLVLSIPSLILKLVPVVGPVLTQILSDSITMFTLPLGIIFYELFYQKLKATAVTSANLKETPKA